MDIVTHRGNSFTALPSGVTGASASTPESILCTWIECSSDQRTWAELTETQTGRNDGVTSITDVASSAVANSPPSWCHPPTTGTKRGCETKRPCSLVQGNSFTALPSPPKCHATEGVPSSTPGPRRGNTRKGCELSIPKYDVCEVFSPPRMCAAANRHGLRGGWSIDMAISDPSTGRKYDLRNSKDQGEVKRLIRRDCPTVLVVSLSLIHI